jgi:Chemoreceptor zinc-binding domain
MNLFDNQIEGLSMRLLDWWKKEKEQNQHELVGAINQNSIKGLDITGAINAHQAWKERLFNYVSGTSNEKLDHNVICRDNACSLGKWIYGEGQTFFSELAEYHKLKSAHSAFHISAGDIIQSVNEGAKDKAEKLLTDGPFAEQSRQVQILLARLYAKITNET